MNTSDILNQLTEGTLLEGPHWTEPVKVLTAKAHGNRLFEITSTSPAPSPYSRRMRGLWICT
jgi:hypothetical protein